MKKGHLIKSVDPGSIAEEMELEPGDVLLTIDGDEIEDIFDYEYKINSEEITLLPKHDFTQRTTPNVIRYNEIRSRKCCQRKDKVFSFFVIDVVKYCFFAIWRIRIAGIGNTPFQKTRAVEKKNAPRSSLLPIFDQIGSPRTA